MATKSLSSEFFYFGAGDIWRLFFDKFVVIFTSVIIDLKVSRKSTEKDLPDNVKTNISIAIA